MLDHLLAHLTLKFLCLTAEFIKLVENRLQFFGRQTGHGLGFYSRHSSVRKHDHWVARRSPQPFQRGASIRPLTRREAHNPASDRSGLADCLKTTKGSCQSGVGRSTESITRTSTASRLGSNLRPSCS
jgi:hypothetical protein